MDVRDNVQDGVTVGLALWLWVIVCDLEEVIVAVGVTVAVGEWVEESVGVAV